MTDSIYYDDRETMDPERREAGLFARLPAQIALAKAKAPALARLLAEVDAPAIRDRAALAALPVLRKSELTPLQAAEPPFGGLNTVAPGRLDHIFMSPGPIYDPQEAGTDPFRFARACWAAGFRPGDIVHNTLSYHFTPGGWMFDTGARTIGCAVIPAGGGNTDQQLAAIAQLKPTAFTGMPSFLKLLLERQEEAGQAPSIVKALVSGEALTQALRQDLDRRGVVVGQVYVTADLGQIAYEGPTSEGMVVDEDLIVEIVRPGTGDPVPEGEIGEVVVTTFNGTYPLIRFATGDLSAFMPGTSPCGRTGMRLRGWLGRANQTTKIRGMFVHPGQVAQALKAVGGISRARLVVTNPDGRDTLVLRCEVPQTDADGLAGRLADAFRTAANLRAEVELVNPGALPADGKVIEDARVFD
ncbi:MAG: AMP-dependent synthetase [Tistrella sp.]|jgi:phenylacetate-CoA ligase|uniref:AMP-dependent synthetase n=1 Tax=Tistrella mobilis TaxID=171437 RepID=A0A3B9IES3_9PROT|nr:AMP-binding protein [Tistrella sp.]MAD38124.1 AMP-dependent synthetase [Tistrella sp.]MBA75454.1 AMP-dependent synthetase [Tistrella sp.]HAE46364.1 AMP-dependent synthetase [Tistrella mobilis]